MHGEWKLEGKRVCMACGMSVNGELKLAEGAEVESVEDRVDAVALVVGLQLLKDVHRFLVELAHLRRPHQNLIRCDIPSDACGQMSMGKHMCVHGKRRLESECVCVVSGKGGRVCMKMSIAFS